MKGVAVTEGLHLCKTTAQLSQDFQEVEVEQAFAIGALLQYKADFDDSWEFIQRVVFLSLDAVSTG